MKKYLNRYLGMGLALLLVLAALFVPQGWFALRDGALAGRVQGEALSLLMVAQLDSSYERDIYERISAYLAATDSEDVICSSKEIDPDNESLWENMEQAESTLLMEWLRGEQYVLTADMEQVEGTLLMKWIRSEQYSLTAEELGVLFSIESCTQYVLMRQSDGQILLVANDILLDKGNGWYMELLIDGVDGTVYYLESEENHSAHLIGEWYDDLAWWWWLILNENYCTMESQVPEGAFASPTEITYINGQNIAYYQYEDGYLESVEDVDLEVFMKERAAIMKERAALENGMVQDDGGIYPNVWLYTTPDRDIYCCKLTYGEHLASWTMEMEELEQAPYGYRLRLGLPCVAHAIPEIADRVSLAEYDQIYEQEE